MLLGLNSDSLFHAIQKVRYAFGYTGAAPSFLVVGAQKCGTTSFFDYLARHPKVSRPLLKEIHYFEKEENYRRGYNWYLAHFPSRRKTGTNITGEATPFMYHKLVPSRVSQRLPEVKILMVIRDPVKRAFSHYLHNKGRGRESLSFEDALVAETSRVSVSSIELLKGGKKADEYRDYGYYERGLYSDQYYMWRRYYSDSSIKIILFEDLVRAPSVTMNEVCLFLGLEDHDFGELPHSNTKLISEDISKETQAALYKKYEKADADLSVLLGRRLPWR